MLLLLKNKVHLPISWKSWRSKKASCHSCGSRNPAYYKIFFLLFWIPASAGM